MSEKQSKISLLKKEIEVKDRLVRVLMQTITEAGVSLPHNVLVIINRLYAKEEKNAPKT